MGNCLFGGEVNEVVIKVVNSNGGIMEFYAPITVEFITDEFPGHGIFKSHDLFWNPLPHQELLKAGEYYYLLPLHHHHNHHQGIVQLGHVRSNSFPDQTITTSSSSSSSSSLSLSSSSQLAAAPAPYRMSFDSRRIFKKTTATITEARARARACAAADHHHHHQLVSDSSSSSGSGTNTTGFWKVKLVISPQQLLEILSQETRTQELIESVRTVAKCGNVVSSGYFPDQWSLTNSTITTTTTTNASSNKGVLLDF